MDLLVWFRLEWHDPRLEWNPDDYGGLDRAFFTLGIPADTDLWYPDILLWNQDKQLGESLYNTEASVTPNGMVYWSRPGHLKPSCKFDGLKKFPFDVLTCSMEFGSWTKSGLYVRPYAMGGGFHIGGSETSGESFNEFSLLEVTVDEIVYPPFPMAPEEDWPVLIYFVTFDRASEPYVRGFLFLQIMLNVIGFLCFWLPPDSGERMGLAVTALLAAVASEIVIDGQLPRTKEFTWISWFSLISSIWAVIPSIESAIVIYFHNCTSKSILYPRFVQWFKSQRKNKNNDSDEESEERRIPVRRASLLHVPSLRRGENMLPDEEQNNEYWRKVAVVIDEVCRVLVPALYAISLFGVANKRTD